MTKMLSININSLYLTKKLFIFSSYKVLSDNKRLYICKSKAEIIGLSSIRLNGLTCFCHRIPNRIHHYLGKSSSFY